MMLTNFEKVLSMILELDLDKRAIVLGDYSYMSEGEKKIIEQYLNTEVVLISECYQKIGKDLTVKLMEMLDNIDFDKRTKCSFLEGIERDEEFQTVMELVKSYG